MHNFLQLAEKLIYLGFVTNPKNVEVKALR